MYSVLRAEILPVTVEYFTNTKSQHVIAMAGVVCAILFWNVALKI